jgi:hypothetical protein
MLDLGGTVLQHGASQATVDSVTAEINRLVEVVAQTAAEQLPQAMEEQIEGLSEILEQHFDSKRTDSVQHQLADVFRKATSDQRHELAKALLDESGPLGMLKAELTGRVSLMVARQDELLKEITSLSERLAAAEALDEEHERGTAKGVEYESIVGAIVEWTFAPYEDTVEDVGTEIGAAGNKCGDHLVVLNPEATRGHDRRVVFESKCRRLGLKASLQELDRALANREAEAAVLVFARSDDAPLKGRSLRVYPGNRIICVLDRDSRDRLPLEVAGHLARTLALSTVGEDDSELDAESIAEDLQRLTEIIDEARSIKRGANAARKGIDQVDTGYEKLRAEALATVGQIASNLS